MSHIVSVVAQYIDTVAMLAQIMVLAIGYPMQIKSLVKSRSAQGASIWMWSSATLAHALWSTRAGIQGTRVQLNIQQSTLFFSTRF